MQERKRKEEEGQEKLHERIPSAPALSLSIACIDSLTANILAKQLFLVVSLVLCSQLRLSQKRLLSYIHMYISSYWINFNALHYFIHHNYNYFYFYLFILSNQTINNYSIHHLIQHYYLLSYIK